MKPYTVPEFRGLLFFFCLATFFAVFVGDMVVNADGVADRPRHQLRTCLLIVLSSLVGTLWVHLRQARDELFRPKDDE